MDNCKEYSEGSKELLIWKEAKKMQSCWNVLVNEDRKIWRDAMNEIALAIFSFS